MDELSREEHGLSSQILFFRFFMLGIFFVGLGLLINKIPSLSSPELKIIDAETNNQSKVLSDKKEDNTSSSKSTKNDNSISINTATQAELEDLPGIGPKTAEKIIKGRPYTAPVDLVSKHVLSLKLFEQIKKHVTR